MMWGFILLGVFTALILGFVWMSFALGSLCLNLMHLSFGKGKRFLLGAACLLLLMLVLYLSLDFVNMVMVFLHLLFFGLCCDGLAAVFRKFSKKKPSMGYSSLWALLLTTGWLSVGWYNAHHVRRTEYNLTTVKSLGVPALKIVGLSDSHVGATFHGQEFDRYIDDINAEHPDLVVIMGDFVDDDTSKADMLHCCKALGRLKTRYGVYYVYGNHDAGYWRNSGRGYTLADLDKQLEANRVKILRDETTPVAGHVLLCGRLDKSVSPDRKSAAALGTGNNPQDYVICLDHEPNDYQAEADSKMDLVISGHTHGGQFLGLGALGVLFGANDAYYGDERRGGTDFIVSSGIGDWAIKFKTGCISEYIVVNLRGK